MSKLSPKEKSILAGWLAFKLNWPLLEWAGIDLKPSVGKLIRQLKTSRRKKEKED